MRPAHEGAQARIEPPSSIFRIHTAFRLERRKQNSGGRTDMALKALAKRRRKEDRRFITAMAATSRHQATGMTHAHFIRSPHAHAKVKSIEHQPDGDTGVVGVLTVSNSSTTRSAI